jgi:hypothetical protein
MMRNNTTTLDQLTEDLENLVAVDDDVYDEHLGQHPALKTMCVIDCDNNTRIVPNGQAAVLENECFAGKVMLLVRTPDVDDPHDLNVLAETPKRISSAFFKGKKRRFEFQFQVKLKRVPEGPLFLGCELGHPIKVGAITKGLVGILLAMARRINPGFHYSWGPDHKTSKQDHDKGCYEKTHLSFPVEASMDRIVITKPGETPPVLGYELYESNESVKRRRKTGAGCIDWNLEDTYTMCLWSAYCDWIQWKSMNVPGMSPFSLTRVTGQQPIYLSVYEITTTTPAEYKKKRPPHWRRDCRVYTRLEFSNDEKTVGGIAEQVVGRSKAAYAMSGESSLPDTESLDSDFETTSRVSHITMS